MTILLSEDGARYTGAAERENSDLWLTRADLRFLMGWALRDEGLCRGEICVPLDAGLRDRVFRGERVNVSRLWQELEWPLAHSARTDTWVFGNGLPLTAEPTAAAPDFVLGAVDGQQYGPARFRGRKVLLVTWASWCFSREELPMWQALAEELADQGCVVMAVALDSRGIETVRPWVERARATFPCLVDVEHRVPMLYRMMNAPAAVWIDEDGRMARPAESAGVTDSVLDADPDSGALGAAARSRLEQGRTVYVDAIRDWVARGASSAHVLDEAEVRSRLGPMPLSLAHAHTSFRLGRYLYAQNHRREGLRFLEQATEAHPRYWSLWRQMVDLQQPGLVVGPALAARVEAVGGGPCHVPPDVVGFPERA